MKGTVAAVVRFLSEAEGGRVSPAGDGVRSQLRLGSVDTSVRVHAADEARTFAPGAEYEVLIELLFWDDYSHLLDEAAPVELYEGSKLVAVGRFIS